MKNIIAAAVAMVAAIAVGDTVATHLTGTPKDVGLGKVVAVAAANKSGAAAAFTVKSVTVASAKAHTNTVVSATVTNTISVAASQYIVPGTTYYADGVGATDGVVWIFVER